MRVTVGDVVELRFDDRTPVRAASAVAPLGERWLVAQDDATHGCLLDRSGATERLRLLPPVEGHDVFSSDEGTKHLKPDLEAACAVADGVLLLGSGSTPARMRSVLVRPDLSTEVHDRSAAYAAVRATLGIDAEVLNLEGACVVGDRLRWFQRRPAAVIGVDTVGLMPVDAGRALDLGDVDGVDLGVTDAVAVPGGVLVAAAAEDSPNAYDDGPVVASALVLLLDGAEPVVAPLPLVQGRVAKVEGLDVLAWDADGGRLLAVVDADDAEAPSLLLTLSVTLG